MGKKATNTKPFWRVATTKLPVRRFRRRKCFKTLRRTVSVPARTAKRKFPTAPLCSAPTAARICRNSVKRNLTKRPLEEPLFFQRSLRAWDARHYGVGNEGADIIVRVAAGALKVLTPHIWGHGNTSDSFGVGVNANPGISPAHGFGVTVAKHIVGQAHTPLRGLRLGSCGGFGGGCCGLQAHGGQKRHCLRSFCKRSHSDRSPKWKHRCSRHYSHPVCLPL